MVYNNESIEYHLTTKYKIIIIKLFKSPYNNVLISDVPIGRFIFNKTLPQASQGIFKNNLIQFFNKVEQEKPGLTIYSILNFSYRCYNSFILD